MPQSRNNNGIIHKQMNTYEVIFEQTEQFKVTIEAKDKDDADDKANQMFSNGEYDDMGNCEVKSISVTQI